MSLGSNERARLEYLKWDPKFDILTGTEKPYQLLMNKPKEFPRKNFDAEIGPEETIADIRLTKQAYNLDNHGFAVRDHPISIDCWNINAVKNNYLPSIEALLLKEFGPSVHVQIFDWRVRTNSLSVFIFPDVL
jgi:hypothetical protein